MFESLFSRVLSPWAPPPPLYCFLLTDILVVGGAVKEGKDGNVTIYREEFSEKVRGVDEAGEED